MIKENQIFKTYGKNYKEMTKNLLETADLISRIPDPKKTRIGIKPNLVSCSPPMYGATTHPEVLAGIIEYLQAHGCERITLVEGSWVGDVTPEVFEVAGYGAVTKAYHVPFIDTQKDSSHPVTARTVDGRTDTLHICDCVRDIDFLINVPVLKGHGQTRITCALKNMKGLIPNSEKRLFHRKGLHAPIALLSTKIHQDFIVVDHICGDLELEDGGNPVVRNCVMAALDPVLLDTYVCRYLGYRPEQVPYVPMAAELGSGSMDLRHAEVQIYDYAEALMQQENGFGHLSSAFPADEDRDPRDPFRRASDFLVEVSRNVNEVDSCSACYGALTPALLQLKDEGLFEPLMKKLGCKLSIGQGFRGKTGDFGIGTCCRQFKRSIPGCPPKEEEVLTVLRAIARGEA